MEGNLKWSFVPIGTIGYLDIQDVDGLMSHKVAEQYESYPYPPRNPEDERTRLNRPCLSDLARLNFYCFRGRRDFRDNFRALVAGGGTGDATIFLAEQLKGSDASVVYLDLSGSSMEIARRRAEIRGLANITWMQGSLLDLSNMGLEPFDYISCTGVLHHLEDPQAGLMALRTVLKDDGAMDMMVYGKYGRTGVYQIQELMRLINHGEKTEQMKVWNARQVLEALPTTNWFKRGEELIADHTRGGDAGIYDLLLHSLDRAYSIPELYELLGSARLHLIEFVPHRRAAYLPEFTLRSSPLLTIVKAMPLPDQQAIAELMCGTIAKHEFYAAPRRDTVASLTDLDNVPFFTYEQVRGPDLYEKAQASADKSLSIRAPQGVTLHVALEGLAGLVLKHLDGRRTLAEILRLVREDSSARPADDEIMARFRSVYDILRFGDMLMLRHSSVPDPPVSATDGCDTQVIEGQ